MGVATVSGNQLTDTQISIFNQPVLPTVTTNGVNKLGYAFTFMFPSTYLASIFYFPYINKSYPETNVSLLALNQVLPGYNSAADPTVTTFSLGGVQLVSNAGTPNFTSSSITTASYPDLKYLTTGLTMPSSSTLTTVNFPELIFIGGNFATTAGAGVTTLSFPKLEAIQTSFTNNNLAQSSLSFPELLIISGSFNDTVNSAMTSYSFPKLKFIQNSFSLTGTKSSLTSISFGALEVLGATFTMPTTATSLTSFSFANTLKLFASNFVTTSNSLNQASVDNILVTLAALDGTNGTVAYSGRTVTITGGAATPSATGLAAKATLQGRGCTVTNN